MAIAVTDQKSRVIYDQFHMMIFVLAVIQMCIHGGPAISDRILGALAVSIPMLIITLCIPGSFGGGDIKLMFVSGFLLGISKIVCAAVLAFFSAGIYVAVMLLMKKIKRKDTIAFGPFLALGLAVATLYGDTIASWI